MSFGFIWLVQNMPVSVCDTNCADVVGSCDDNTGPDHCDVDQCAYNFAYYATDTNCRRKSHNDMVPSPIFAKYSIYLAAGL